MGDRMYKMLKRMMARDAKRVMEEAPPEIAARLRERAKEMEASISATLDAMCAFRGTSLSREDKDLVSTILACVLSSYIIVFFKFYEEGFDAGDALFLTLAALFRDEALQSFMLTLDVAVELAKGDEDAGER